MKPFNKMLVPVDFSTCSAEAVRVAADMSRRYEADLCLLYVYEPINYALPPGYPSFFASDQLERILADYNKHLLEAKAHAEAAGARSVETHQLQGTPTTEIVEFARKRGFDLIIMGTHGRTGIEHALVGSVTERVMRKAPCAVLAIRATAEK